jgi:hypothetical protein
VTVQRCELSDLPADACACRIHKPGQEADTHPGTEWAVEGYGPPLAARYSGRCPACGDRFERGDPIRVELTRRPGPRGGTLGSGRWVCGTCASN